LRQLLYGELFLSVAGPLRTHARDEVMNSQMLLPEDLRAVAYGSGGEYACNSEDALRVIDILFVPGLRLRVEAMNGFSVGNS
jgi:hypothetical protein